MINDLLKLFGFTADNIIKEVEKDTEDLKKVIKIKKIEDIEQSYDKDGNLIIQSKINK